MVERYRDLVRPTLIDTSPGQYETGDSQAANALADSFKQFSSLAGDVSSDLFAKQGQNDGAAAGASGQPKLKGSLMELTAYGRAYNNSAARSYSVRAQSDADEQAARLEVEAGTYPESFRVKFGAVRDATIKEAPAELRSIVADAYNQRLGAGLSRLQTAQASEHRNQSRTDTSEGVARFTDHIAQLRSQDTEEAHAQADEEEVKLGLFIEGAKNDGTLSATEAAVAHITVQKQIVQQSVYARFDRELQSPYGNPVKFIQNLKEMNKQSEALPPAEEAKLQDGLMARLRDHNSLLNMTDQAAYDSEKARLKAGNRSATTMLFSGQLTNGKLLELVQEGDLEPERATTLHNMLKAGNEVSDPKKLFEVKTQVLSYTEEQIADLHGISWEDKGKLVEELDRQSNGWRGTQQAREAADRIDRELKIPPGTPAFMLLGTEVGTQRATALKQWYDKVDALPANERQSAVIPASEEIIDLVIRKNANAELASARAQLERYKQGKDPAKMSKGNKEAYDAEVDRLTKKITNREVRAK